VTGSIDAPENVRAMFDRIASRYDLMNGLMTGWQDRRWRAIAAQNAVQGRAGLALDAATGTGALAKALRDAGARKVIGVDASSEMLIRAASNLASVDEVSLLYADVMELPFESNTFDACTIGFGLRNLPDYRAGIAEMTRVLVPGGRLVILELTPMRNLWFELPFDFYFGRVVPLVGWLVAGDIAAYRYLPDSVRAFPDAPTLAGMMHNAGLTKIRWRIFGGGSVALHVGVKAEERA
jgi:demethylmenaquinone methyltransferase/2-methoxy-6-polyprenyl-1,4-benzoquinol methylase